MTAADPLRRSELAAIHVAAKQLALHDDNYRALIARFSDGRTESAGDMTPAQRHALLDHFRTIGFKPKAPRRAGARRLDFRPHAAKLRALWLSLWQLGVVEHPTEAALAAFLKRHTSLDALQFADGEDFDTAINCLRSWCKRVGYDPWRFESMHETPQQGSFKPGLIEAQWQRLAKLGAFRHGDFARLDTWLRRMGFAVSAPQFLTHAQADEVISTLGKWIRRLAKPEEVSYDG